MSDSVKERYFRLLERDRVGDGAMTRRRLVGAIGALGVLGAGGASGGRAASAQASETAAAEATAVVGSGATGRVVLGFIGKVTQEGTALTAFGYLTGLHNVAEGKLFTAPRGASFLDPASADESQARFTVHSVSEISTLSLVGRPGGAAGDLGTIVSNAHGSLTVHFRKNGGADFDDPASFAVGPAIASFDATFQNNLTLQPPDFLSLASVALGGHLVQTAVREFGLDGKKTRLGRDSDARRLDAAGWGELTEPSLPRSTIWLAGTLSVVGSDQ